MMYLGNYLAGTTIDFIWSSNGADGASITRATNGTVRVYKGNSTTETTTGVTDTEDFDGLTGIHHVRIATSDSFYAAGNDFMVVLAGATIDGKSVNAILAHFSIENRSTKADVTKWNGTAVASPATAGYPAVTIKSGTGTGELNLSSGEVALSSTSRAAVADDVWDEALSGHTTADTAGKALTDAGSASGNVTQIGGSTTAVTNLKADYDGTGYAKPNSTVGTVSDVTNVTQANVVQIGGSQTAREKLADIVLVATRGTVGAAGNSTTTCGTNLTEATTDHYKNLLIRFVTGALAGQSALVTAYNGTTKVLTFTAVTDIPAEGDTFILV